ncbi:phosphotriesterase family protein [Pareuzebyella sediminis]|uniref:phosphotriesterase family protein n=1 Tax=Pareuzebyella sediminis TaxID=2607998 RepID=UPI001E4569F8|nr:phosphotriesterase [Pareuzebyella sediminis]
MKVTTYSHPDGRRSRLLLIPLLLIWYNLTFSQIMTVNGTIPLDDMGLSLIHEHVMVDWIGADSTGYQRWDRDKVVKRTTPFLEEAKARGVNTFIDCTPAYLGRDPYVLRELSNITGMNILTNTGFYGARNNKYIPKNMESMQAEKWADIWLNEFHNGIDNSGIRPGFIKISVDGEAELSTMHKKIIKAAAITHLGSGLTIVSHTGPDEPAMAQLRILKEMGVSPAAFVWTHAQGGTFDGYEEAVAQGAWVSLDHISEEKDRIEWFVETLLRCKENDMLDHILISHDSGWYTVGEPSGGDFRGYTSLFEKLIPALRNEGFSKQEISRLLVENPKHAYAIGVRKL